MEQDKRRSLLPSAALGMTYIGGALTLSVKKHFTDRNIAKGEIQ